MNDKMEELKAAVQRRERELRDLRKWKADYLKQQAVDGVITDFAAEGLPREAAITFMRSAKKDFTWPQMDAFIKSLRGDEDDGNTGAI